jgi:predicted RNA-binding Zn-ribbon protein involved in translation (DUF1610 family)
MRITSGAESVAMLDLRLKLTSRPAENIRIVVRSESRNSTILFKGKSGCDLLCGQCGAVLAERVERAQFNGPIFVCSGCGAHNDTIKDEDEIL